MQSFRTTEGWYDGRPVAAGFTPWKLSSAKSSIDKHVDHANRVALLKKISRHSGNSVDCPRSASATKRFIPAPRKSCGNHIARITSSAAFSHSQGQSPLFELGSEPEALGKAARRTTLPDDTRRAIAITAMFGRIKKCQAV
jgi:hypothetical protein